MPEIEPGARVVGTAHQVAPKIIGGRLDTRRAADAPWPCRTARRENPGKCRAPAQRRPWRWRNFCARRKTIAELDGQFRHHRRDFETAREHLDRLVMALHGKQQTAELVERRGIRRPPLGRALEPRQCVVRAGRFAQRDGKLRIDLRIVPAARGGFERRDGVLRRGPASATRNRKRAALGRGADRP